MPRDGIGGKAIERLGTAAPGDGVVVVARENGRGRLADECQGLGGKGAVADDVAEADDAIDAILRGVGQDAAKGLSVRVDVGDECVSHDGTPSSSARGCGGQDMGAVTCVMVRTSAEWWMATGEATDALYQNGGARVWGNVLGLDVWALGVVGSLVLGLDVWMFGSGFGCLGVWKFEGLKVICPVCPIRRVCPVNPASQINPVSKINPVQRRSGSQPLPEKTTSLPPEAERIPLLLCRALSPSTSKHPNFQTPKPKTFPNLSQTDKASITSRRRGISWRH